MNETKRQRLAGNWQAVVGDVRDAEQASGRPSGCVQIVGVTKYVNTELTTALVDVGCHELGENRPQVLWEKTSEHTFDAAVRWHMIGHLQRNKVRRTLKLNPLIHSVDSQRLLNTIAAESESQQRVIELLIEVNISDEAAKTGIDPAAAEALINSVTLPVRDDAPGVRIRGLMAMASHADDPDQARQQFAKVRQLRDTLQAATGRELPELSMGMSGDFRQAISEGATMVRIGSRIYEGVRE